jgi:hypothetical protein
MTPRLIRRHCRIDSESETMLGHLTYREMCIILH